MKTTLFAFVEDFLDEGPSAFSRISQIGVDGVAPAFVYHTARDVLPHARSRQVRFMESGSLRFRPNTGLYGGIEGLPLEASVNGGLDPIEALHRGFDGTPIEVEAWVVFGHSSAIGQHDPELTIETAFGDRLLTTLCPSNPRVRSYFTSLVTDLGQQGIRTIFCEGIDFPTIDHGYHHERWFVPVGETTRFLVGCCFCRHCLDLAEADGLDPYRARAAIRAFTEQAIGEDDALVDRPLTQQLIHEACGEDALAYVLARRSWITESVARVSAAAGRVGAALAYLDLTGARNRKIGPAGVPLAADDCWRYGIDPAGLGAYVEDYLMLGYSMGPEALRDELETYRARLGTSSAKLGTVIRPGFPDVRNLEELRALVSSAADAGCARIGFYAYAFMRVRDLERLGVALKPPGSPVP